MKAGHIELIKNSPLRMIPSDWEIMNIGNSLNEIYRYPTYFNIKYVESGVPEIRGELIKEGGTIEENAKAFRYISKETANRFPRVHLEANDFVMSVRGTMGKIAIVPKRLRGAVITANLIKMKFLKSLIEPKWIRHYLTSDFFQEALNLATSATTIKTIQVPQLCAINFIRPPINEQRRIAEILDTIDEAIQKTEALISKLKAMKQGLINDLLTRGLDENGRLRDPKAHPEQFKDSLVGRIPKEWDIKPLEEIAEVDRGKFTHRPRNDPRFYGGKYPFVQTGDIANAEGRILDSYSQTLNDRGASVSREFPKETIAITMAANIADTAILGFPMYFPDSVVGAIVRPSNNVRYIELCIRNAKKTLEARAPQSAQKNINLEDLRPLIIAKPKYREQHRIGDLYNTYDARIRAEEKYRDKLKLQKKGLMHDLLTGKVRVKV